MNPAALRLASLRLLSCAPRADENARMQDGGVGIV